MSKTRQLSAAQHRAIIWLIIAIAVIALLVIFLWEPIVGLMGSAEQIKQLVERAGIWGPLVFMGIQFLQVLVAPIPGQVAGVLAGALFGPWLGTLYSMLGALVGFTAIFFISRRLGRPFVERFVKPEHLEKFDYLTKTNGAFVFFLIFLLPGFPDDIICYMAGLSKIPIRTLVLVSLAGRLPGYILTGFIGSGMAHSDARLIGSIVAGSLVVLFAGVWQRGRIEKWVKQLTSADSDTRHASHKK